MSTSQPPKLFSLRSVCYSYQNSDLTLTSTILSNINLDIYEGEFVSIMGASGSGKSTLLNILGLLTQVSQGEFSINERVAADLSEDQLAQLRSENIGFVFQNFNLLPKLTALENVCLPARFAAGNKEDVTLHAYDLFKKVGLEGLEDRLPSQLSGGQKQRVAICRALILKPKVLLADEPTGALDSITTLEILDLFASLIESGLTVVLITHDPKVAEFTNRQIHISDGAIVLDNHKSTPTAKIGFEKQSIDFNTSTVLRKKSKYLAIKYKLTEWFNTVAQSMGNLKANKLRTVLTGIGLTMGVTSILVISGLGTIVESAFNALFYNAGTNKVYVYFDAEKSAPKGVRFWQGMSLNNEFPKFVQKFAEYGRIRPFLRTRACNLHAGGPPGRGSFLGLYDYDEVSELGVGTVMGRMPSPNEVNAGDRVALLGATVVDSLFPKNHPARTNKNFPEGETLVVSGCEINMSLKIVGVLAKQDAAIGNRDSNDRIYAPAKALQLSMGTRFVNAFSVMPNPTKDPRFVADYLRKYLESQSNGTREFATAVPKEIIEKIRGFLIVIQVLTGFIGGLCIVVGGIGIMNILIVTVTERVKEIGLLKSLGANSGHIRNMFLVECSVLCLLAGLAGVALGLVLCNIIGFGATLVYPAVGAYKFIIPWTGVSVGLLISLGTGLGFGFLPAWKASRMDPAQCLRDEGL